MFSGEHNVTKGKIATPGGDPGGDVCAAMLTGSKHNINVANHFIVNILLLLSIYVF